MTQEKFLSTVVQRKNMMCALLKTATDPQRFIEDSKQKDLQQYDDDISYLVELFYDSIAIDFKQQMKESIKWANKSKI